MKGLSKSYYMKPVKIVQDLVHGDINLTRFDLELIDTVEFQRLGDIRQLTCQHVYPSARHTRFEHSLGVLELMRGAIRHLNRNGVLGKVRPDDWALIDEEVEFSAAVAALLHDIGHCPFSHMGETQFDKKIVRKTLAATVKEFEPLKGCTDLIKELEGPGEAGSVHEQLSCIVILKKYRDPLLNLNHYAKGGEESCELQTDFELIVRSILGIKYRMDSIEAAKKNQINNVIVNLLHSNIFDVDKLDYVMRDSHLTGIGAPAIDTKRIFRNMYLDDNYSLIFTSRAVTALQNLIDARNGLYLSVYNHHAVVYSDFLNTYISSRLAHNAKDFFRFAYPTMSEDEVDKETELSQIFSLGLVPKSYLFSVDAVVQQGHSDSAWLSLLNVIHTNYCLYAEVESPKEIKEIIRYNVQKALKELDPIPYGPEVEEGMERNTVAGIKLQYQQPVAQLGEDHENELTENIYNTMLLIHQAMKRDYLKPWWKTVSEFSNFMYYNFRDDRLRKQVGKFICDGGEYGLKADEMRSQIAKHVVYITQRLDGEEKGKALGLLEELNEGGFFVIQRPTNFLAPELIIALKNSEIFGSHVDRNQRVNRYYLKSLKNTTPQKVYSSIYEKDVFYIFSRRPSQEKLEKCSNPAIAERKHYELLKMIFVFVTTSITNKGELAFVENYQGANHKERESATKEQLYKDFMEYIHWTGTEN